MRKSTASSVRSSHAGSLTSQHSNSQAQAKLLEKKKEFELLQTLERMAAEHARRLDAIHTDCDVMADAGRVFGDVLSQWPEMFRILSLSASQLSSQAEAVEVAAPDATLQHVERLVRLPIEELQPINCEVMTHEEK